MGWSRVATGPSRRGGTRQEGGKEANPRAGRSRGAAQRPTAPPLKSACDKSPAPLARWPSRARTTQQERAQPERASGHTWPGGVLSRMCNAARLAYQRTQLCRGARAPLARRSPPRAQPATPDTTREPPPPVPVPACVATCARAQAQCGVRDGEARHLCPPSCGNPSANHARVWRAAMEEARDTAARTPPPRVGARGPAAAAERDQARLA